jgi:uncharacterized protein
MAKSIFVNLPVKDLERSKEFFRKLGYEFNPQFTDQNAASMIIEENIYVMLLVEDFFKSFTKKEIPDPSKSAGVLIALDAPNREEVDKLVHKAVNAGATTPNEKQDHGFMYSWGFQDLDGHLWEVFYMEPEHVQQQ